MGGDPGGLSFVFFRVFRGKKVLPLPAKAGLSNITHKKQKESACC
jgi:hypothetical protein